MHSSIPQVLRNDTERHLARFAAACAAAGVEQEAARDPRLAPAFAVSTFVADVAASDSQWFVTNVLRGDGAARSVAHYRNELTQVVETAADEAAVYAGFRRTRNRELARIAWRDIVGGAELMGVTGELSAFADACIGVGLRWLEEALVPRFGRPRNAAGEPVGMIVIGMGKLGGLELNFSSDIDLIFTYPEAGTTAGGRRELSNQEYFDRLGKALIALLSEPRAEGIVFRVDMRLRPFGDSGPLTSNFDALEHYYQLHGRDWERYALIKARVLTEDPAARRLRAIVQPFVYRRYLDFGALEAVRDMKALIDAEVARRDLGLDVKLGAGGIREIEFIGQTFQLIRGGREPTLQQRSILAILDACVDLNLLEADDAEALTAAYRFLRQTEHRLQQAADRQTHRIPDDATARARLAFAMGFPDYDAFATALAAHRTCVARCFGDLLRPAASPNEAAADPDDRALAARAWRGECDEAEACAELGFDEPTVAAGILAELQAPRFLERLSREGRERLDRLMPHLIAAAARRTDATAAFARLGHLIRAIARRSVYLSLLTDHPATLERLVDFYHASPWIAQQITQHPILLDELLDPRELFAPPGPDALVEQLHALRAQLADDDTEQLMEMLRQFRNQQVLRVAASDVTGHLPVAEVSNQLSYIAEALLEHALDIAHAMLRARHGVPCCTDEDGEREVGFAIVAYGKLGGLELGYGSDLDLVFLHDGRGERQHTNGARSVDNAVYFTRLTQRIIHLLSTLTPSGRAYDIDTRLRPSGASGLLVSSIDAFATYQKSVAWTWEHQALIRARAVAGDARAMDRFRAVRVATLAAERDCNELRDNIVDMRARMRSELDRSDETVYDLKQGRGGITDIEFMVQYAVLKHAWRHPQLLDFTDNLRLLDALTQLGLMPAAMGAALHDAWFAYRAEVHRCALLEIDGLVGQDDFLARRAAVSAAWDELFATD